MSDKEVPNANGADGDVKFTVVENKFFVTMFKYLPKNLEIDWDRFAKEMGLKDGSIAKTRCRQIRTKHGLNEPAAASGSGAPINVTTPKPNKTTNANNKTSNANNKVTKARKPKQQKRTTQVADDVADDTVNNHEMAGDAHDDEA
ncbi:hypothetical protein E0Z10_g3018 [Xylaria hypoxylon]|uniref:Uncharacterized protein n=1 Tax=Xylaria hypoxylon TaxID=37992 RepID=A0A4Z0Z0R9_9PEZI|nr:hypothetical protein E0Z10_g3018 [Xylaria hypoxylon]